MKFLDYYDLSPIEFLKGFDLPDLTKEQQNLLLLWSKLTKKEKEIILPIIERFIQ